jgi:hypothetical protein
VEEYTIAVEGDGGWGKAMTKTNLAYFSFRKT